MKKILAYSLKGISPWLHGLVTAEQDVMVWVCGGGKVCTHGGWKQTTLK